MTRKLPTIECGKIQRKTFSKIKEAIELPYLVKIQKDSYDAFIKEGITEVLEDFSPITDYSDHFELYFLDIRKHRYLNSAFWRNTIMRRKMPILCSRGMLAYSSSRRISGPAWMA